MPPLTRPLTHPLMAKKAELTLLIDDAIVSAEALFSPLGITNLCAGKEMATQAHTADALIIRSRTKIDEDLLSHCPSLKFVGSSVVGLDHVDQEACARHNLTFYSAQGCNARSVAEYVISHLVAYVSERETNFAQITLGIVGVGQVGRRVEQMARSLGIHCLLNDPPRAECEADFHHTDLADLLAQADIITVHTPLTQTGKHPSHHLLAQHNISLIAPNCLLINAARGGVLDESALMTRDDLKLIIDCRENEPFCRPDLLMRSRCATPHIAGHAREAKYRGGQMVAQALASWLGVDYQAPALLVPDDQLPCIHPAESSLSPIAELAFCLKQIYDFSQDDRLLRTAMQACIADDDDDNDDNADADDGINTAKQDFARTFEDYRRHYPDRYEWQHIRIPQALQPQTKQWLSALGLQSKE